MGKLLFVIVIFAQGLGNVLFVIPLLGIADSGRSSATWLLGAETLAKLVGSLLWLIAISGGTPAGIGVIGQRNWWRIAGIIAFLGSLVGIALFWRNPASSSAVFAAVVDLAVLFAILVVPWPTIEMLGA